MSNVKVTNLLHGSSASNNITLASDGTTTIPTVKATTQVLVGGVSSTANGGTLQISNGITFPATQSACSDVNTLDDYEEGTWTPSLGGTATYTAQTGTYTKIGRLVHISVTLVVNTIGTGSTTQINTLPFTIASANNDTGGIVGYVNNAANNYVSLGFDCYTNSINVYARGAASGSALGSAFFGNGTDLRMTMVYITG